MGEISPTNVQECLNQAIHCCIILIFYEMLGTQSALQKVHQIIWKEIEILCAEYELSTEELQAVSGGWGWYDRGEPIITEYCRFGHRII